MVTQATNKEKQPLIFIAIFASGTGTNAQKIIDYFKTSDIIKIKLVVSNKPFVNVLKIAEAENIPWLLVEKDIFFTGDGYLSELQTNAIMFIVLAGFLWKIPTSIVNAYSNRIINIHPALLPRYGGKNMYGSKVHEEVLKSGDKISGITVHYVNGEYDKGNIIFQKKFPIDENETVETLTKKIHLLEHENYPRVIEEVIKVQIQDMI